MADSYKEYFDKAQRSKGLRQSPVSATPLVARAQAKTAKTPRKSQKPKKVSNGFLLSFTLFGFLVTAAGTFYLDEIAKFLSRIEIGVFARAGAEEPQKKENEKSEPKKEDADKTASKDEDKAEEKKSDATAAKGAEGQDVELNHFARLRERKTELDKREEGLTKMETELQQQRQELEQKLKELEEVRRKISSVLEEKVQADDQKIDNLVQFYSNMKAPQAAKIIESIDEDLAVQVIAKMKKKNAADIMNLLKPEKAQSISEKYVGYKK